MNPRETVLAIVAALQQKQIPYVVVGAFASNLYGIERSTRDADFVIQTEHLSPQSLAQTLGNNFIVDPQARIETFTFGTYYSISRRDAEFTIDLFLLKDDPHDQSSFQRRKSVPFGFGEIFVPTPEDLIITKLRWVQEGRRNKDVDDVLGVLTVQTPAALDLTYIRHWTTLHGTLDLFEKLLSQTPSM